MDIVEKRRRYRNIISRLRTINSKIDTLNSNVVGLSAHAKNGIVIDGKYVGEDEIKNINNNVKSVSNAVSNSIIPSLNRKINNLNNSGI